MENNTWVKNYRKMTEWEWYTDIPVNILFNHLLRTVNYIDKKWKGIDIPKGSKITGLSNLSKETGLSIQQIRTALTKLKSTGEVTEVVTMTYRHIQVQKWEEYQEQSTEQSTNEQQPSNKASTATKEGNKVIKKENNTITASFFNSENKDLCWYIYSKYDMERREVLDTIEVMHNWIETNKPPKNWKNFCINWLKKNRKRKVPLIIEEDIKKELQKQPEETEKERTERLSQQFTDLDNELFNN